MTDATLLNAPVESTGAYPKSCPYGATVAGEIESDIAIIVAFGDSVWQAAGAIDAIDDGEGCGVAPDGVTVGAIVGSEE
jgi:hypothetical protein